MDHQCVEIQSVKVDYMDIPVRDIDLRMSVDEFRAFLPMVLGLVCFVVYWFVYKSPKVKFWFKERYGSERWTEYFIPFTKFLGGGLMGLVPLSTCLILFPEYGLESYGLVFQTDTWEAALVWGLGGAALIVPFAMVSSRLPRTYDLYPQIRSSRRWPTSLYIKSGAGWAGYLLGYEVMFRGVLLFPLAEVLGVWPAIAVNILMYSATHLPKGRDETVWAIPLAVFFSIAALQTGSMWPVFFAHLSMCWTNSFTTIMLHPEVNVRSQPQLKKVATKEESEGNVVAEPTEEPQRITV